MATFVFPLLGLFWITALWLTHRRSVAADLLAGGLLFLLVLGFFWRTLSGDVYQPADGGDLVSFLYPTWRFAARELAAGSLPLWNPHLYAGAPFIGDIQAGFLYLPNLILFLLWPEFPYVALQWLAVLHLYVAGLGMYVLLRTLRPGLVQIHPVAALFGALAFTFCDPLLTHLGNLNLIAVLAWMPWVLALFMRALAKKSLRWAALAGLLLALATYAGHAQSTFFVALALVMLALAHAVFSGSRGAWRAAFTALAVTAILALLLAAPILLPALELTSLTERSTFAYQESVDFSLAPMQLIGLLTPGFFGRGPALHWSLWQRVETPYIGVAALLLAVAGMVLGWRERRRDLIPWLIMALVGLLLALGIYAILHGWLAWLVPFYGQLRAPARALILWALGASVLAGAGLDSLLRLLPRPLAPLPPLLHGDALPGLRPFALFLRTGVVVLVGVVTPLAFFSLLLTQGNETTFLRASVAALALVLAALWWLATWLLVEAGRAGWLRPALLGGALAALLFVDLAAAGAYTDISPNDPTTGYNHPEIVEFLKSDPELFRIDTLTEIQALWQPDTAALAGLQDVGGIANPLTLSAWQEYWAALGGRESDAYQALNVKYLIARDGTPLPANFSLALDAPGELSVFANNASWPRAWLESQSGDGYEPARPPVIVEEYRSGYIRLRAAPAEPTTLGMSEIRYPGWQVRVDGAVMEELPARGGLLRRVALPAGEHVVEWEYRPGGFYTGLLLAGVGLLLTLVLLWLGRGERQPSQGIAE